MTAEDIMVVMQSFCPTGREILNVTVYPSDYGKEQMEHEAKFGPKFLSASSKEEVYETQKALMRKTTFTMPLSGTMMTMRIRTIRLLQTVKPRAMLKVVK